MTLPRSLVALSVLAALASAGSSAASRVTPKWLPPETVDEPDQSFRSVDLAVSPRGDSLVVYAGLTGVEAVFRPAGGGGGSWARLAPCGSSPKVGFDGSGRALAVWLGDCEGRPAVKASARTAGLGGQWQELSVTLSTPAKIAQDPHLSMNTRGDAVASWEEWDDWGRQFVVIQGSVRSGATGEWEPAAQLSSTGAVAWQSVNAINTAGDAVVAYTRSDPSGHVAWTAYKPGSGLWQPAQRLSEAGNVGWYPSIALDAHGNAVAVWLENVRGVSSFRSRQSGAWEPVTAFPGRPGYSSMAVDSNGNALAVWPGATGVLASSRPAGPDGRWTDPELVSQGTGSADALDVAFDADDAALVLWARASLPTGSASISASRRPAGTGAWEQPAVLEVERGPMHSSQFGVDASGNAIAAWEGEGAVLAALLDAAAPALRVLSVPAKARPGRAVRVSASFDDVSETTLRWRFGDGATATGSRARHVYRRPGGYRVRITAVDAAGHATTVSKPIRIAR